MPKRKRNESKEERWKRKMKKYEDKLQKTRRRNIRRISSSSEEDDVQPEEHCESDDINATNAVEDVTCYNPSDLLPTNGGPSELPNSAEALIEDSANVFDAELIEVLGSVESEVDEYGDELHNEIAIRFQKILVNGLSKEVREELTKKYAFPKNVPYSKAPTLNPEIEVMLVENCRLRDKRLFTKQNQIGRALSALGKAMTGLLKKNPEIPDIIRTLNDTANLIADSHYAETETRRTVIIPLVDKSLTDSFKNRKRDNFLFGDSLGEVVKTSRGIKKTSQLIQAAALTSSRNLNFKSPTNRPRQQWVGQPYAQQRVVGQRTSYSNRNRRSTALNQPSQPTRPLRQPPPPARRQTQYKPRAAGDRRQK